MISNKISLKSLIPRSRKRRTRYPKTIERQINFKLNRRLVVFNDSSSTVRRTIARRNNPGSTRDHLPVVTESILFLERRETEEVILSANVAGSLREQCNRVETIDDSSRVDI